MRRIDPMMISEFRKAFPNQKVRRGEAGARGSRAVMPSCSQDDMNRYMTPWSLQSSACSPRLSYCVVPEPEKL